MSGRELADRQAIVDVIVRLAGILDRREWDRLPEVFHPDAVAYRDRNVGLAAIEAGIRSNLGGCGPSQHLVGNHEVTIHDDADTASVVSKIRVLHAGLGDQAAVTFECLGDYHDRLVRTPDGWRIVERVFDVQLRIGDPAVLRPG